MRNHHKLRLLLQISQRFMGRQIARAISVWLLLPLMGLHSAIADTVAETSNFAVNANKVPTGASTKFFLPIWTNGDATRTAHHELLHAFGFSEHEADDASGTILAKLTAASQGTHIDPNAGIVNEYDQSKSVMTPNRVTGQRMGAQEKSVQNAAFDWSSRNINITVSYVGSWSNTQKSYIESAVSAAKTLFGSDGSGHKFTWMVEVANSVMPTGTQDFSSLRINDLSSMLVSGTASQRVQATAEILARGVSAVPELLSAGAQPMSGLSPRRIDVLYSILSAYREGRYRTNSFELHVEPGTTRQEIVTMGERNGFVLPGDQAVETANAPCCYVTVRQGSDLWDVIARVLSAEPKVTTVNLNYIEP